MLEKNENFEIVNMIYKIRGQQIMLDSDLARLYQCKNGTKTINQAVKRNIERFPSDFYFQLTIEEYNSILRSQSGTLELKQGQYSKYLPYVFTEQGVAMLASILRTSIAAEMSVRIMRAFVLMKKYISTNLLEQKYINNQDLQKYNKQYKNIKVKTSNKYHDRFIILDNKTLYHSGASFKDLGKKCFCISKIENDIILNDLLKII